MYFSFHFQGDKGDPMNRQLEKERLERIQREGECCLLFERQFNLVENLCASFELLCAHHQH